VTLGPPLWGTGTWAVNAWANGSWATSVVVSTDFGDLSTLFTGYVQDLRDAAVAPRDNDTLVAKHRTTVRAASTNLDDANTMYAEYLS
jgi:hypothetical protein